jgi:hypothetical protein
MRRLERFAMRVLMRSAVVLAALSCAGAAPAEEKCPKGDAPIFEEDLKSVDGCVAANALHEACAWGSSGDAGLSGVVIPKCEAGFLAKLTKSQRRVYDQRGTTCDTAYVSDTDSMQTMQSAMCREELAVTYFKASASGAIKSNPRWKAQAPLGQ